MAGKPKNTRVCILLPINISRKLDVIAKIEGKNKSELLVQALKDFVPREIEERQLDKQALYKYLDTRLSYEELVQIIGREKASVARYTKDIRSQAKEFLKTLDK